MTLKPLGIPTAKNVSMKISIFPLQVITCPICSFPTSIRPFNPFTPAKNLVITQNTSFPLSTASNQSQVLVTPLPITNSLTSLPKAKSTIQNLLPGLPQQPLWSPKVHIHSFLHTLREGSFKNPMICKPCQWLHIKNLNLSPGQVALLNGASSHTPKFASSIPIRLYT